MGKGRRTYESAGQMNDWEAVDIDHETVARSVLSAVDYKEEESILEVGCGAGHGARGDALRKTRRPRSLGHCLCLQRIRRLAGRLCSHEEPSAENLAVAAPRVDYRDRGLKLFRDRLRI